MYHSINYDSYFYIANKTNRTIHVYEDLRMSLNRVTIEGKCTCMSYCSSTLEHNHCHKTEICYQLDRLLD